MKALTYIEHGKFALADKIDTIPLITHRDKPDRVI